MGKPRAIEVIALGSNILFSFLNDATGISIKSWNYPVHTFLIILCSIPKSLFRYGCNKLFLKVLIIGGKNNACQVIIWRCLYKRLSRRGNANRFIMFICNMYIIYHISIKFFWFF